MANTNNAVKARSLPNNTEAEQSLLGCIMVDADLAIDILSALSPDDFYIKSHQTIVTAMQNVVSANKPVDLVTLSDYLERAGQMNEIGGMDYLITLSSTVPSAVNYKVYMDIVKRAATMRQLIHSCSQIIDDAYVNEDRDNAIANAEKKIYDINQGNLSGEVIHLKSAIPAVLQKFDEIYKNKGALKGVESGFAKLDRLTNGFQKGTLNILAALTGVGKTSLAMNMVENAAKKGSSIAFFSLEMPKEEIGQRLLCSLAGVHMQKATTGALDQRDWISLWEASDAIAKMNIFVDDSSITTPAEVLAKCRRLKNRVGLDFVVIDYLQLMSINNDKKNESRQQEVSEITRNLKIIAKELGVPILALSQLSREAAKRNVNEGKEPVLSDLRESGSIEQDADMVMFIYKKYSEEQANPDDKVECELIVAKHRAGPTAKIPLLWLGNVVRFVSDDSMNDALTAQYEKNRREKEAKKQAKEQTDEATTQDEQILPSDQTLPQAPPIDSAIEPIELNAIEQAPLPNDAPPILSDDPDIDF